MVREWAAGAPTRRRARPRPPGARPKRGGSRGGGGEAFPGPRPAPAAGGTRGGGGGAAGGRGVTAYREKLTVPVEFVDGLRVSDPATVEVAKMVLVGKVNKDIVLQLGRHGQPAVGLSGDDGLLFRVARQAAPSGRDIGLVGRIDQVDEDVIKHVAEDYIPVVASVGADREGVSHNINADEAAGAVAGAMGAYKLMFLTDVEGWLRDPDDPASVVSEASAAEVTEALPSVSGGMRPKLQACVDAIAGGGPVPHLLHRPPPPPPPPRPVTAPGPRTKIPP